MLTTHLSTAECENVQNYASTPPYVFKAWNMNELSLTETNLTSDQAGLRLIGRHATILETGNRDLSSVHRRNFYVVMYVTVLWEIHF
jgi:hypothetical protein